ncbi:hypothetical protein [Luteolibacter rhizosphaerae]|nr:hypothetical protein [Luteolibacter rhizosphaerae]
MKIGHDEGYYIASGVECPHGADMKHHFAALEALLDSINPIDQVESLKAFAAIDAVTRVLEESFEIPPYPAEKLRKFRGEALHAIVPGELTRHLPSSHYIAEARFALRQANEELVKDD